MNVSWENLWWLLWVGTAGACAGSFLNMLIFRLPHERSLVRPLHSYCPLCETQIRWFDNIPLLSYMLLAGRCRSCRTPISPRYPLIEALTALTFILIVDAFYVGALRPDLQAATAFGTTGQVAASWPILLGHLVLAAGLLAVSAMDLEEYYVDIRVTWFIALVGLGSHALQRPITTGGYSMSPETAGVALAACVGLALSWIAVRLRHQSNPERPISEITGEQPACDNETPANAPPVEAGRPGSVTQQSQENPGIEERPREPNPLAGCFIAGISVLLFLALAAAGSWQTTHHGTWSHPVARCTLVIIVLFATLVGSSIRSRPADAFIMQVIEEERHEARKVAFAELLYLLPAIVLGALVWWWLNGSEAQAARTAWTGLLNWPEGSDYQPMHNLLWAATSMLVAGGIGWGARILFTLLLGKEALGLGDVHIMWAAGAVTGWAVIGLGFFAAAFLAVLGMILLLGFKRSRAIPFGPWLGLGILLVVVARDPIFHYLRPATDAIQELLTHAGSP